MNFTSKINESNIRHYETYYDIGMSTLAIFIIVSLFMQNRASITENELSIWKELDYAVWIVFVFDYVLRFSLAKDKPHFIRTNIIELISILPFDVVFQGLRAVRIIRLIYMFRVFIYLNRLYKRLNAIITTNDFHHVLWFTFSSIFCGAIAISYIDDIDIGDALWWSFVTTTTVGYGDIAPQSLGGRIVAVCLMLIGIGFLSMLTGTIATFFINNNKASYKNETIQQIISRLDNFSSLSIEDINDIHSVLLVLKQNQKYKEGD
jgi:voltage-gated potassium channel